MSGLPVPSQAQVRALAQAVTDYETVLIAARAGECPDGLCGCEGDPEPFVDPVTGRERGHECERCGLCEQRLAARLDDATGSVVEAVVGCGLRAAVCGWSSAPLTVSPNVRLIPAGQR